MRIVSISEIVELNALLQKESIPYKIHVRDACAKQSFFIEALDNEDENEKKRLYEVIETFFERQKIKVVYADNYNQFTVE